MSKVLITRSKLDNLATTISAKSGASLPLTLEQMDAAVDGIVVGSGTDTSHDTVDAAHLLDGYTAHDSTGTQIVGSYTPPTFATQTKTATPTETQQTVTPDSGYDGLSSVSVGAISSSYVGTGITRQAAQTIYPSSSDQSIASGRYLTGAQTIKGVAVANLTAANIKSGVIVTVGDSADADRIMSVTGTYSGGSSKNVQTAQSTTRVANTTYTKTASFTCSVTGTYDVYWDCFRSSTSGTNGSQLYIGGSAYGTANTTFATNIHAQSNHLTGVQIDANQEVAVYVRSRATNYYAYCGQLTIVQTS